MQSVSENDRKTSVPEGFARFSVAHVATEPRTEAEPASVRFGVAVVAVGTALVASLWLVPYSYTTPFLLFYPAVLLAAWFGGLGPGLLATAVAALSANYFMLAPYGQFSLDGANLLRTFFFAATFGAVCWLAELARRHVQSRGERLEEALRHSDTDAKQAHQQLQLQSAALESAANAIVITDRQGTFLWCNPAFTQLTGYTTEEVLGCNPRVLRSGEHEPQFYADMWNTILSGAVWHGHLVNRRKNGSLYTEEMTITPVRSDRGEITHFIAIKVDVTERKRAQQALIRSEKLAATGRLAATIAHEINNPLEAMTNLLYLIGPTITEPTAREYFDLLEKQLQAVSRIASQTLNFHRENSRPAKFNLAEVVGESVQFYQPKAKKHGVTLIGRIQDEAGMVGFPGEIRQVVSNLLLNAIEATPAGGNIAVYQHDSWDWRNPDRRGYRITVLDSGCGIESQHRARIFEPFFTTKGEKGTGLGLWVSFGIVQRAGGSMRVWSARRPGLSGTCFSVFLPTEVPATAGPGRRRYESAQAPDAAANTG